MARFTLIELHLDGAQFTAHAPFSGEESGEGVGKTIERRLGSETESTDTGSSSSGLSILLGLVAVVGFVALGRRLLSRKELASDETEAEEPIFAD